MKCFLMNREHIVLTIEYDIREDIIKNIYEIHDLERCPLSFYNIHLHYPDRDLETLNIWFRSRSIPYWRKNLDELLPNLGVSHQHELLNKAYALSLSDQYWINPGNIEWKNINFFHHDFDCEGYIEATLKDVKNKGELCSPTNTTDGMLPKLWIIENGRRILVKSTYTNSKQEPTNEWLASQVCRRMGFDYVDYSLDVIGDKLVSKCENFIQDDEELITAFDVYYSKEKPKEENDFDYYCEMLKEYGLRDARSTLKNMFFLDYLVMNEDRHMKNFGLIRNIETLHFKLAPIYDTGQAMNCENRTKDMDFEDEKVKFFASLKKPLSSYRDMFDLSSYDTSRLDGLAEEYKSILYKYQSYTGMSDERINKLAEGFEYRIKNL